MSEETLKALVMVAGDPEAGIPSVSTAVDLGLLPEYVDEGDRNFIRESLTEFFSTLWDGKAGLMFSDDCELCHGKAHKDISDCPAVQSC